VTTFGEPRVGNQAFADAYNAKVPNSWRVVNGGDTVPHTPLFEFGYYHEGVEIWLDEAGTKDVVVCTSELQSDDECSNSLVGSATLLTPWTPMSAMSKLSTEDHCNNWVFGKSVNLCPLR